MDREKELVEIASPVLETCEQGFALRDPDFGGDFDARRAAVDDGRDSLAVAIRRDNHMPGTTNITWKRRAIPCDQAVARFVAPVRADDEIARRMGRGRDRRDRQA